MEKKTYGARGYMDWVARIPIGGTTVQVHFTGGALTQYGVTPAEYTTTNTFFQKVIEGSEYYKDGRIELLRKVHIPERGGIATKSAPEKASITSASTAEPAQRAGAGSVTEEPEGGAIEVKVSCLRDAQEYMSEHYGVPTVKVRTREMLATQAAEHGIKFVGIE